MFTEMKSRNLFNAILPAAAIFLITFAGTVLAQDVLDKPENAKDAKVAIEQALKDYEKEKQEKQGELTAQLNFQLGQATETWITAMEKEKDGQLGKFIEQDWDKQPRTAIILPPVRYDYYLRGYRYDVNDSDVIKTESITSPYKGVVAVKEELYAEKYHHPNTSDTKLFYYTVTSIYSLEFAYKDGEFILVNSASRMENMVNSISNQARRQWIK